MTAKPHQDGHALPPADTSTPTPAPLVFTIPPMQFRLPGRGGLGLLAMLFLGVGSAGAAGGVLLIPPTSQSVAKEAVVEDAATAVNKALLEKRVTRLEEDSNRLQSQLEDMQRNVQGIDYDVGLLCQHFELPCQDGK